MTTASPSTPTIKAGIYEHYKGNQYRVYGVALQTETLEPLVVYSPLYTSDTAYWVRPYDMFLGTVVSGGRQIPRFRYIRELDKENQ